VLLIKYCRLGRTICRCGVCCASILRLPTSASS
jgi:hypothetical protein